MRCNEIDTIKRMLVLVLLLGACWLVPNESAAAQPDKPWLVAGPVALVEQSNYSRAYYKAALDALPTNWITAPLAGDALATAWGTSAWRAASAIGERPDLRVLPEEEHALYFARHCWVSPVAQAGELRVGSDDALRVWLNGSVVFSWYYGRGYTPEQNVVPVQLRAGTNTVMFALVNGTEAFDIGARLYPSQTPLENGVVLDVDAPLQTGAWAALNWYWMPAAGLRGKPHMTVWSNAPPCDAVRVLAADGRAITNILRPSVPVKIELAALPQGVYQVEVRSGPERRCRSFARLPSLDATQAWWMHLLAGGHFFSPEALWQQMTSMRTSAEFTNKFHGTTVRAYQGRCGAGLEPYGLSMPLKLIGQSNMPLVVHLAYYSPSVTRETWSMGHLRPTARYDNMLGVWPYCYGNTLQRGLGERDVLDVIEDVSKLYSIDENRIYLVGYSAGGSGCWRLAARHPDRFAAMAPCVGYDLWGYVNVQNMAVWQYVGGLTAYGGIASALAHLRRLGADARLTVDENRIKPVHYSSVWETLAPWLLSTRRERWPRRVVYTTYGDVDGAYWVRNILPVRFGHPATVMATFATNAGIQVDTENVASFALDLCGPIFTGSAAWRVTVDGHSPTNAAAGGLFNYVLCRMPCDNALRKRNGFCGGVADVAYDSFVLAYATGPAMARSRAQAAAFQSALCGTQIGQLDARVLVVPDTELSPQLCTSNNVILFTAAAAPGPFLTRHSGNLPFSFAAGAPAIGGLTGTQMLCVCPNPVAPNRYLLTVIGTNLTVQMLYTARCDVLLDHMSASFDAAWRNVLWDDAPDECGCGEGHMGAHDHGQTARAAVAQPGAPRATAQWRAWLGGLPWGWLVPGAWLALLLGWAVVYGWHGLRH